MSYMRYAIYYVPPAGALSDFGAHWFGWDIVAGRTVAQPDLDNIVDVTKSAGRYGFHATLKAPFHLAEGETQGTLRDGVATLAKTLASEHIKGFELVALGRFFALVGPNASNPLSSLAEHCVKDLDRFRAPLSATELERRLQTRLSARQKILLEQWGYPHVLERFRFHMTLTGKVAKRDLAVWHDILLAQLPDLSTPHAVTQIALVGERPDGFFELIERFELQG